MRKTLGLILTVLLAVAMLAGPAAAAKDKKKKKAADTQFFPILIYRTGPFAAGGSGIMGGFMDYMQLVNVRDGGINGIKLSWEECETAYNTARGVECYERLKGKGKRGASLVHPLSTGITYALIDRATRDKIPVVSLGYGRTDASDGSVFPYIFPLITNYWSQNSAKIRYIASLVGGEDKLKGIKIANLHLDHPYGRETIFILNAMAKRFGFEVRHFPVPWPGIDQKSLWLQIARRYKPDFVINRNWGVSCTVPLKEAARLGFPRERILGVWWCGSEEDVVPAAKAAIGYKTTNFHGVGTDYPVMRDILDMVYGKMKGHISSTRVGNVFHARGVVFGIVSTEAVRTAQGKYGKKVLSGEEVRWGLENLNITKARLKEIGAEGFMAPLKTSCANHEGGGEIFIQQWTGTKWKVIAKDVKPYKDFVWKEIRKSAAKYAKEKGITPRKCTS